MNKRFLQTMAMLLLAGTGLAAETRGVPKYAIKAGKIVTMRPAGRQGENVEVINHGVVLVRDGKIEALGPARDVTIPADYRVIDAADRWVMPGIVEAHTHIGTEGGFNDMVQPLNPELRMTDCVNPEDFPVKKAITGGVTTIHTMPGSGTNLGGFTVIIKTAGATPEEMIVRELGAMKATQAYNPERDGGDLGHTRMGMAWMLRYILREAKEYTDAWQAYGQDQTKPKPKYRPELEQMRQTFEGKIPTIIHTYEGWGVMETIRMFGDEAGLKIIPTHTAGGGYVIGHEAAKRDNVHVNIGPRVLDFGWSGEEDGRIHGMGAEYRRRGVENLSINTDAVGWSEWMAPQEELFYQAAMSARLGITDLTAMKAITINSARALGIDDRVGSLEIGKDADIVIKQGTLLDVTTPVDLVLVNGRIAYRRKGAGVRIKKNSPEEQQKEAQL